MSELTAEQKFILEKDKQTHSLHMEYFIKVYPLIRLISLAFTASGIGIDILITILREVGAFGGL